MYNHLTRKITSLKNKLDDNKVKTPIINTPSYFKTYLITYCINNDPIHF